MIFQKMNNKNSLLITFSSFKSRLNKYNNLFFMDKQEVRTILMVYLNIHKVDWNVLKIKSFKKFKNNQMNYQKMTQWKFYIKRQNKK